MHPITRPPTRQEPIQNNTPNTQNPREQERNTYNDIKRLIKYVVIITLSLEFSYFCYLFLTPPKCLRLGDVTYNQNSLDYSILGPNTQPNTICLHFNNDQNTDYQQPLCQFKEQLCATQTNINKWRNLCQHHFSESVKCPQSLSTEKNGIPYKNAFHYAILYQANKLMGEFFSNYS